MLWEISLLIIAIAFFLLVVFSIPAILQVRRTAHHLEQTSRTLNHNLPGILTNVDEITTNLTRTTQTIRSQVESLSVAVEKIQNMVDDVVGLEKELRNEIEPPIVETLNTITAIVRGLRTFLDVLKGRS